LPHNFKVEIADFSCKTIAKLEMVEGKYLISQAEMFPVVKLKNAATGYRQSATHC
jgi:hypothetical protein